jgi:hypothetical protein
MVRSVDLDESSDISVGEDDQNFPRASTPIPDPNDSFHLNSTPSASASTPSIIHSFFNDSPEEDQPPPVDALPGPYDPIWADIIGQLWPPSPPVSSPEGTISVASGYSSDPPEDSLSGDSTPPDEGPPPFQRPPPSPDVSIEAVPDVVPNPQPLPDVAGGDVLIDTSSSDSSQDSVDPVSMPGPPGAFLTINPALSVTFRRLRASPEVLAERAPPSIKRMYCGRNSSVFIKKRSSCGRKIVLTPEHQLIVEKFVQALLQAEIISPSKRRSFVSYPFLVAKATGEPRFIVDYSHLRGHYDKPHLHLPHFCAALRRRRPTITGNYMARIDLKDAFYSVPLPPAMTAVTAFRVGAHTYTFNALPMGLYVSPRILQAMVQTAIVPRPGVFTWIHMDDIIICASTPELVHDALIAAFRSLDSAGFNISIHKSQLVPSRRIRYCGLILDTTSNTYDIGHTHLWYIRQLIFSIYRLRPEVLGYVSYWLYAIHLTAAIRRLVAKRPDVAWRLLNAGPWPLPRPPQHLFCSDASEEWLAAVDGRANPLFCVRAPRAHIYYLEMLALFLLVVLVPPNSAIGVDNQAVIGALRRSRYSTRLLVLLSWLCASKDICIFYIPSAANPADTYTRANACRLVSPQLTHSISKHLARLQRLYRL